MGATRRNEYVHREDQVTFGDLESMIVDDYERNQRKSLPTLKCNLKALKARFEHYKALAITEEVVHRWQSERQNEGASNATINRQTMALSKMFSLAVKAKKLTRKPVFALLPEADPRDGFVTPAEFDAVKDHLPADLQDPAEFLFITAWRVGEVRALKWRYVDLEEGTITLPGRKTKNGKAKPLKLFGRLREIIDAQRSKRQDLSCPYVFTRSYGGPVKNFRRAWESAAKAAGRPGLLIHDLRRSGIKKLVTAGVAENVAMSFSGHRTRQVFDRYNIIDLADQERALEQLDTFLEKKRHESARFNPITR